MSHPSLLEYPLSSRCPVSGWLSKRFGISTEVWVCPTLPVLRQKLLLIHSPMLIGYCTMFRQELVTLLELLFSTHLSGIVTFPLVEPQLSGLR
ncbi:MAG: hypothetical protein WBB28_06790 [Crinalium sp.]